MKASQATQWSFISPSRQSESTLTRKQIACVKLPGVQGSEGPAKLKVATGPYSPVSVQPRGRHGYLPPAPCPPKIIQYGPDDGQCRWGPPHCKYVMAWAAGRERGEVSAQSGGIGRPRCT